jgi:cysteinyl-tRNA synthetase
VKELAPIAQVVRAARGRVAAALDDDLNAPVAVAVLQDLSKASNELCMLAQKRRKDAKLFNAAALLAREALSALRSSANVLGLLLAAPAVYAARTRARRLSLLGVSPDFIEQKIVDRSTARAQKEFARSDAIRAELEALGVEIYDSPTGTTWKVGIKREAAAADA